MEGGWGVGGVGVVSFCRWLRGPMLSRVRVGLGWGGGEVGGGVAGALLSLCGELRTMEGGWSVGDVGAVSFRRWLRGPMLSWVRVGWGGGGGGGAGALSLCCSCVPWRVGGVAPPPPPPHPPPLGQGH